MGCDLRKEEIKMKNTKIVNIENENGIVWIDKMQYSDGKTVSETIPVAPWSDADTMVKAIRVIARLAWN